MRRRSRSTSPVPCSLRFACAAVALSLATPVPGAHAAVDLSQWVTDGGVSAVISDGGTLYVGGGFQRIGPATGSGVPISTTGMDIHNKP